MSPSGKAVDSDSTISRVQILPPQPNLTTNRLHDLKWKCNPFVVHKYIYIKHGTAFVGALAAPWVIQIRTLLVVTLLLLMVCPQRQRTLLHPFFFAAPISRLVWLLCLPDIPSGYSLDRVYRIMRYSDGFRSVSPNSRKFVLALVLATEEFNFRVWTQIRAKSKSPRTNATKSESSWQKYI